MPPSATVPPRSAWRLREAATGADYSYGALGNVMSFISEAVTAEVLAICRAETPVSERAE
jgi:hypothetical protein